MNTFEPVQDGICGFCGKKVEERFFSGSYETYKACECKGTKIWEAASSHVRELERKAQARFDDLKDRKDIDMLEKELARLRAQVKHRVVM